MKTVSTGTRAALSAGALLIAARIAWSAPPAPEDPLTRLRLLPPVLIDGEKGWALDERMRHYKVEGVSVAVVKDFRVLWVAAAGLADREERRPAAAETLFQAGSISKPVAATAVMRKAQDGALRLDADINAYLKSWKVPENEWTAKRNVSFELLLSHGAGLTVHGFPGYAVGEPVPSLPQVLDGAPPANTAPVRVDMEPGKKWRYSGGGYTIAQLAMTDRLGKTFPDLMRELVLKPAAMTRSTYEQPLPPEKLPLAAAGYRSDASPVAGKRHTYPEMAAAGLWTTAGDLARFGIAIQRSLRGEAGSVLRKESALRMVTPFIGDYGLGFAVEKHGGEVYFGHGGADEGFQAVLIMDRDGGYGAAVMTNSDNGVRLANEIVRGLARAYGWKGYLPEALRVVKVDAEKLAQLAGRYQTNGDEAFALEARRGGLVGQPPAGDEFELFPIAEDLFVRKDRETRYKVESSGGNVTGVTLLDGEERVTARRMAPGAKLPSDDLAAGRIDEALAAYHALFASKPDDPGVAEGRLNNFGYQLAGRKEYAKAIAILKLNTELYPASSNTYDSLGEVYGIAGDRAKMAECARKLLEVLPADKKTDAALEEQIRRNAEARIKEATR